MPRSKPGLLIQELHRMKYPIFFLSLLNLFTASSVYSHPLSQEIDTLIEQSLPSAYVGMMIQDAQSGKILYERNAHKLFTPASSIKLLTAAAALYQFGTDYQYETSLSRKNDTIYITFTGSPTLTTNDLKHLIGQLKKQNITTIKGDIVLDTSRFAAPYYPEGLSYEDLGWYFAAPSSAVILNENAVNYEVISAKKLGQPIQLKAQSPDKIVTLINEVITVSKEQEKQHCKFSIEIKANNTLKLYGCMSQNKQPVPMRFAIPDPTLLAKHIIQKTLRDDGIQLKGNIIEGKTPQQTELIATKQSGTTLKLVNHMLQESDDLYADSLTKSLAFFVTGEGTYKQGTFAIKRILTEYTHLDTNQLLLSDGFGSRFDYASPQQLVMLLTDLYHDTKLYPLFLNALPHMGTSGTLISRMKTSLLEDKVIAKTGTMHDMSSLSGYMILPNGRTLIFSMISNNVIGGIQTAKDLEDKILLTVFKHQNNPTI